MLKLIRLLYINIINYYKICNNKKYFAIFDNKIINLIFVLPFKAFLTSTKLEAIIFNKALYLINSYTKTVFIDS